MTILDLEELERPGRTRVGAVVTFRQSPDALAIQPAALPPQQRPDPSVTETRTLADQLEDAADQGRLIVLDWLFNDELAH